MLHICLGGQKISSIPEGLFVDPGEHGRVRVYLKVSCCVPAVQFVSFDKACVVDVRGKFIEAQRDFGMRT